MRGLLGCEHCFALEVAAQPQRAGRPPEPRCERSSERALADAGEPAHSGEPRRGVAKNLDRAIEITARQPARLVALPPSSRSAPAALTLARIAARKLKNRGSAARPAIDSGGSGAR